MKNWYDNTLKKDILCRDLFGQGVVNVINVIVKEGINIAVTGYGNNVPLTSVRPITPQEWWDFAPWNHDIDSAPNSGKNIFLKFKNGYVGEAYKCESGEFYLSAAQQRCNDPIAWLPLPENK